MIGFAKIAGGAPSKVASMTRHLMNKTLRIEDAKLAAYYGLGLGNEGGDKLTRGTAQAIADGDIAFSEGVALLVERWERQNPLPGDDEWQAWGATQTWDAQAKRWTSLDPDPIEQWEDRRMDAEQRFGDRLDTLVERAAEGLLDAPLAVVRQDAHPLALQGLGIAPDGILTNDEINALLAGRRADGELIDGKHYAVEQRLPVDPKTGEVRYSTPIGSFDFSVTPDKTVSVAWAFADDAQRAMIYQAHIEAAREAVAYIGTQVGVARFGDAERQFVEGYIAWLEFTHHAARQTMATVVDGEVVFQPDGAPGMPGDPDLHTHFLIPNAVFCPDGRVGSLDTEAIRGFLKEATVVYHMRLAAKLNAAGFETRLDERHGVTRMVGVPDEMRTLMSKRTMIGEALAMSETKKRGEKWDDLPSVVREARMKAAVQHWEQKHKGGKDDIANFADWRRQAREVAGWEPTTFLRQTPPEPTLTPEQRHQMAYDVALPRLDKRFQQMSVLPHFDVRVAAGQGLIAAGGGTLADVDAVTKLMREHGVTQYGEPTALTWGRKVADRYMSVTTQLHEAQEKEFISLARRAFADRSTAIPRDVLRKAIAASGLTFDDAHGRAVLSAIERVGTGGKLGIIVAAAGAGKTSALRPIVAAKRAMGGDVWGDSLAWRQADDLTEAGIDEARVKAFSVLVDSIKDGTIKLGPNSTVAADELALLGTRQGLELLRLRDKLDFSIIALADPKQIQSIESGSIVNLLIRALGPENVPEIATTRRQESEREQIIAGLFRRGEAAEALGMKRQDGTAEMVPGGYVGVIKRVADLYAERLAATGVAPTISAPTNADAHRIAEAVRAARGIGRGRIIRATDGQRNYAMEVSKGDRIRLFKSTGSSAGGSIGRNGSVLEVLAVDGGGLRLRNLKTGREGDVPWSALVGGSTRAEREARLRQGARVLLAYGDAMTIHTAQGSTSNEHIFAMPNGSKDVNGKLNYSASTRHRIMSYLLTSEAAEREGVRKRRPLNDVRPISLDDQWANVARSLAQMPMKENALEMLEKVARVHRGTVRALHRVLAPAERSPAAQAVERVRLSVGMSVQHVRSLVQPRPEPPRHQMARVQPPRLRM